MKPQTHKESMVLLLMQIKLLNKYLIIIYLSKMLTITLRKYRKKLATILKIFSTLSPFLMRYIIFELLLSVIIIKSKSIF